MNMKVQISERACANRSAFVHRSALIQALGCMNGNANLGECAVCGKAMEATRYTHSNPRLV